MTDQRDMIPVAKLTLSWGGDELIVAQEHLEAALQEIRNGMDDLQQGDEESYTIRIYWMPRAEYDALPEFEGF